MRLLLDILAASLVAAFICWVGGAGGVVVLRVRALERRVDGHDDDFEAVNARLQRREGRENRSKQLEQKSALDDEIAAIQEANSRQPAKKSKGRLVEEEDGELDDLQAAKLLSTFDPKGERS